VEHVRLPISVQVHFYFSGESRSDCGSAGSGNGLSHLRHIPRRGRVLGDGGESFASRVRWVDCSGDNSLVFLSSRQFLNLFLQFISITVITSRASSPSRRKAASGSALAFECCSRCRYQ
jgi:hypothetical protein